MKNIINHSGTTRLLAEPKTQDGKFYPFSFDAVTPEEKQWSYRLVYTTDERILNDDTLTKLLKGARSVLRADWEEQVGHPVGFITIHLPPKDGDVGSCKVQFERGPDLTPSMNKIGHESEPTPPKRAPEPEGPDMSF